MVPHLEPGDRFVTVDGHGQIRTWLVRPDGLVVIVVAPPADWPEDS